MNVDDSDKMTSDASPGSSDGFFLRTLSLVVVAAGAVGSIALMLRAGQRTPRLLLVLFIIWVLSPFVALVWANNASKRWTAVTRAAVYCVTLVVALGSLMVYGELVDLRPAGSANAFLWVAVPPASLVFLTLVVSLAALISRQRSRRGSEV
jgi:hypothetical protein